MLEHNLILNFQQKFKELQINAGLGVDESNIGKTLDLLSEAYEILEQAYNKRWPEHIVQHEDIGVIGEKLAIKKFKK